MRKKKGITSEKVMPGRIVREDKLELKSPDKLYDAWRIRAGQSAKGCVVDIEKSGIGFGHARRRCAEARGVGHIEGFEPKLQAFAFCDADVLDRGGIPIPEARPIDKEALDIASLTGQYVEEHLIRSRCLTETV